MHLLNLTHSITVAVIPLFLIKGIFRPDHTNSHIVTIA
nr:MAG TPA: hypothetical protein [Caudoviricetes sp.]